MSIDDLTTIKTERPTHLSAETLAQLEALLNEERRELIEPADDPNSITDLADDPGTRLSERQMLDQMSARQTAQLAAVDHAIQRMQLGAYGTCEECGDEIPFERLEAVPASVLCISCQSRTTG
ncbi:MAG TPA: TraR/DksA family transcriptional regulator [Microthrixaceae bacterium]|nr:TraR/DksA family transcriptional regulator [Microthrixaceae bacterium]